MLAEMIIKHSFIMIITLNKSEITGCNNQWKTAFKTWHKCAQHGKGLPYGAT